MSGKSIGIAAGCGFILSFLTGIISGNAFLTVLLRAFIFAIIFAALAAGISFLLSKFLVEDSMSMNDGSVSRPLKTAGNVDIVIQDDNLDDDESGPKFYVEGNRQGLQTESLQEKKQSNISQSSAPESAAEEEKPVTALTGEEDVVDKPAEASFVPAGFAGAEKVSAENTVNPPVAGDVPVNKANSANKVNSFSDGSNIENIDSLPEIADLSEDKKDSSGDIIDDSDFATAGSSSSKSATFADGQEASAANADVMAQAIRTLLAKEN